MGKADDTEAKDADKGEIDPWAPLGTNDDLEAALACLPYPEDPAEAREIVKQIARYYNYDVHCETSAPEVSAARDRLASVKDSAQRLEQLLADLTEWEILELDVADSFSDLRDTPEEPIEVMRRLLRRVGTSAELASEGLPVDGRGQPNMYRRRFTSAKWTLTVRCGRLLEECGAPATGSTAPSGRRGTPSLARLTAATFQYATGLSSEEEGIGLDAYVKKVGGIFTRQRKLNEEMFRRSGGKPIGLFSPGSELFVDLAAIGRELGDALRMGMEEIIELPDDQENRKLQAASSDSLILTSVVRKRRDGSVE